MNYQGGFYLYSMKRNVILLVFIFLAKFSNAQQDLLSFDEHNKYIFYEVVDMPGISADSLHSRGMLFLKKILPGSKLKPTGDAYSVNGEGKFITYTSVSVLKHESGEIAYTFNMEFKDQKYRFWLTGFTFTPYERDRYGNFVPKPGIEFPLEKLPSKLEKRQSDNCLNETGSFCKQFGGRLKAYMLNVPKKEENTKKVISEKW